MNEVTTTRDPIKQEIVELHGSIMAAARVCLAQAIRIGELLGEAKKTLGHGKFSTWCENSLPFKERTVRNYMRLYRERDKLKTASVAVLTDAYKLLTPPPSDLSEAYRTVKAVRESVQVDRGRMVFEPSIGETAINAPGNGKMQVGRVGEFIYVVDHAPGTGLFYVSRILPGETATIDGSYHALTPKGVAGFIRDMRDDANAIQWQEFPARSAPTILNSWLFGPKDQYARRVA